MEVTFRGDILSGMRGKPKSDQKWCGKGGSLFSKVTSYISGYKNICILNWWNVVYETEEAVWNSDAAITDFKS